MRRISRFLISKLLGGAVFGVGMCLAFALIFFLVAPHVSYVPENTEKRVDATSLAHNLNFSELTTEEKIKMSSAIALGTYRHLKSGDNKIVVQEYLKEGSADQLKYGVGDEISDALAQKAASDRFGDGVVIFFVDSPPRTKMTATYAGGVIYGLNNISIDDFRKLVAASR